MAARSDPSARSSTSATTASTRAAAKLLELSVDWAEQQFRELGRRDARDLAIALVGGFQGAAAAHEHVPRARPPVRQSRRLERWIDSLG